MDRLTNPLDDDHVGPETIEEFNIMFWDEIKKQEFFIYTHYDRLTVLIIPISFKPCPFYMQNLMRNGWGFSLVLKFVFKKRIFVLNSSP